MSFLSLIQAGAEPAAETPEAQPEVIPIQGMITKYMDDPSLIVADLQDFAVEFGPKVLAAIAVFLIGLWISKLITKGLRKALTKARVEETLANFLGNLAFMILAAIVAISAVQYLGVPTTSFVAIIGAAGLAVGFALQGSLGNFAAGVMIMLFRPFKVGDWIEAGGHSGSVEEIQVFMTLMKTGDNKRIILPNAEITGGSIVNYSAKDTRRIDLEIGISYGDDIQKTREVLARIMKEESRVLETPETTIAVAALGDNSVNFVVRPWVKGSEYWPTRFDLMEKIKLEFDREGISFPFPQRDVHLYPQAPIGEVASAS